MYRLVISKVWPAMFAAKESATEAKVIAIISRSWFRYAAAAVVTGVVFGGFYLPE